MNWRELAYNGVGILFLVCWITPLLESEHISRTVGALYLFGGAAALGAAVGACAARPIARFALLHTKPKLERLAWFLVFTVSIATLFVFLASLLNRAFPSPEVSVQTYAVISKYYSSRRGCLLSVATSYGTERFQTSPFVCQAIDTRVQFVLSPGNLSFDRVLRIRSPQ